MDCSIIIKDKGYCAFKRYDNYVIGHYFLRTMRNGKQDIAFHGILVGKNGINPYDFIKQVSVDEFEKSITVVSKETFDLVDSLNSSFFQTFTILLKSQMSNSFDNASLAYINRDTNGSFTVGKKLDIGYDFFESIFIQKREDSLTMKINSSDPFGNLSSHEEGEIASISSALYEGLKFSLTSHVEMCKNLVFNRLFQNSI